MRECRPEARTIIACGMLAFTIALMFAHWKSQSERSSTVSVAGAEPLRAWSDGTPSKASIAHKDSATHAVEATPAVPPLDAVAAVLPSVQPSQAGLGSENAPPPDLGPEFIPEFLQTTIRRYDGGMQSRGMLNRGVKSQLEYWSERKNELDQESPDQWSRDMEARLREFFESLPQATSIRADIACRPSQCLLRIVDMPSASEEGGYRIGAMTLDPGSQGIRGIMWRLVSQPWFKVNLIPGNNQMYYGDSRCQFSLIRFTRVRKQE
jgi:hypothetical protein